MNPAKSYIHLLAHLKAKFSDNPKRNVRLLGLVFCRPDNRLAREEILPSLAYYHHRSGKNVDFFFAGFDEATTRDSSDIIVLSGIPSKPEWSFNLKSFDDFRENIEEYAHWKYSGGSDFMLVNCCYAENGEPHLYFEGAVILTLEELRRQDRLPDVGILFEKIFRHCESVEGNDEAWGCGHDADPGSALMKLCRSFLNDAGGRIPTDVGPNRAPGKEAEASSTQTPNLLKGEFRYDLGNRSLIITQKKIKLIVPIRYAEVMNEIFKREDGLYAIRVSQLDLLRVATFFEMGRWKEENPAMNERQLHEKLNQNIIRIENEQKKLAQEFRRQFSRWLRENEIEADSVITADRNNRGYKLGTGWHSMRMVINDSEAGLKYASHYIENVAPDSNTGKKTPKYMGTADGKTDFED